MPTTFGGEPKNVQNHFCTFTNTSFLIRLIITL
ncbi:hypothetical protein [Staphylococcus aureus]